MHCCPKAQPKLILMIKPKFLEHEGNFTIIHCGSSDGTLVLAPSPKFVGWLWINSSKRQYCEGQTNHTPNATTEMGFQHHIPTLKNNNTPSWDRIRTPEQSISL